ncbi:CMGC protein kinase, variant 1 [Aphanomyces astaci]|uniref:CMGC protein kinase, variant 1 n=1 Tax=Aphanomyces astaci TaxID=112090 RepID=W4GXT3_APHAT|nr:CMGC protein kinase, variant 1 [Aphanomyces astaci]ETV84535.1 CMGC protein kinase, variant 1 [Aphanomyces astaci]|eukprot:XP_009826227.1 CMGC protein kinase, variant 1 [Aphanomyces astaci]
MSRWALVGLACAGVTAAAVHTKAMCIATHHRVLFMQALHLSSGQCRADDETYWSDLNAGTNSLQTYVPPRAHVRPNLASNWAVAIAPGDAIQKYQLIERTAVLGLCGHDAFEHPTSLVVVGDDDAPHATTSSPSYRVPWTQMQLGMDGHDEPLLLEGPSLEYQCSTDHIESIFVNQNYRLRKKFDGGAHGEVWRAIRTSYDDVDDDDDDNNAHEETTSFVLKRMFVELGEATHLSGQREVHFGHQLRGEPHVARFVESFYRDSVVVDANATSLQELWLVFYDEGISLRHYMYSKTKSHMSVLVEPSLFWKRMRLEDDGAGVYKEILRQLLEAVAVLHDQGITHRDIKPSNILISQDDNFIVKLADFGSAVDTFTHEHLYGAKGPSQAEETREYQPPEVLFHGDDVPYDYAAPTSYDLWSVGVVALELLLGSPHVFSISSRARAKVDLHLRDKPPSLARYHADYALVHRSCNFGTFNTTIQARDPLGRGLTDPYGLHLLWQLLQWDPAKRISAREALVHAYFQGPYVCNETGRHFPTEADLVLHQAFLHTKRTLHRSFVLQRHDDLPDEYFCSCGRAFSSVDACNRHLHARRHATPEQSTCRYAAAKLREQLPPPRPVVDSTAFAHGHAMFNGRRRYMEDTIAIESHPAYDLYVVLDGHMGLGAATFVRQHIGATFALLFADIVGRPANSSSNSSTSSTTSKAQQRQRLLEDLALRQTLADVHAAFLAHADDGDFSGTTCTLVVHFRHDRRLVVANVGDSRAVLYTDGMDHTQDNSRRAHGVQLTQDHSPHDPGERRRIESSGGFVSFVGVWRVMGQLAVSRSLGDRHLSQYVSCDPTIYHVALPPSSGFVVVASDGVWESMTSADVGQFVSERLRTDADLYEIAADVVVEAFVRGSSDNLLALIIVFDDSSSED